MIGTSDGGTRPHSADRDKYSTNLLGHWVRDQQIIIYESWGAYQNYMPAGCARVKRDAIGIDYVVVNGTVLLDKGELTDALPGQIVRGPLHRANHP